MCVDNGLWRVIVCMLFFPLLYTSFIAFRYFLQLGHMRMEAGSASAPSSSWLINLRQPSHASILTALREKKMQPMGCLTRFRAFFTAPVVIFHMNILSYFTFLLLFAYVLMVDFQPSPSWWEYLIYFWLFSLVCEEIRQVWGRQSRAWEELGGAGLPGTPPVPMEGHVLLPCPGRKPCRLRSASGKQKSPVMASRSLPLGKAREYRTVLSLMFQPHFFSQ